MITCTGSTFPTGFSSRLECQNGRAPPIDVQSVNIGIQSAWRKASDRMLWRRIVDKATHTHARTHTHTFNSPFSGTTWVSWYQKGKTNADFTEARDSEWPWQICTSLQTDIHASTPPLSFLQAGCPSSRPTNSVKALKATLK